VLAVDIFRGSATAIGLAIARGTITLSRIARESNPPSITIYPRWPINRANQGSRIKAERDKASGRPERAVSSPCEQTCIKILQSLYIYIYIIIIIIVLLLLYYYYYYYYYHYCCTATITIAASIATTIAITIARDHHRHPRRLSLTIITVIHVRRISSSRLVLITTIANACDATGIDASRKRERSRARYAKSVFLCLGSLPPPPIFSLDIAFTKLPKSLTYC